MATKPMTPKQFERDVLKRLSGVLPVAYRIPDGIEYTGNPNRPIVHTSHPPADLAGCTPDGRSVLVEVKCVAKGSSIACERGPDEEAHRRARKQGYSGVQWHQAEALMAVQAAGGVGLLVVRFAQKGVYLMDGHALRVWVERGDTSDETDRKSISIAHMDEFGEVLGLVDGWDFPAYYFKGAKR